ncbi:hypothetical protein PFISCL1PPCAC_3347, partial [Pristionchus fissidentatus]
ILPLLVVYPTAFASLYVMRRKLLAAIHNLATPDRSSHRTILRTLTIQIMLPIVYIFAVSLWLLDLFGIVESTILRRIVVVITSLFALVTPLVNLYYLPPYRKCVFFPKNKLT